MDAQPATLTTHGPPGTEAQRLGPWFHNLHLPDGSQTAPTHPLGDFPRVKWLQVAPHVPDDLSGLRVIDIGCNAGFYTFELAKRGAHVTSIDIDERYLTQARWAAKRFGLRDRIEFRLGSVYSLRHERSRYDLTWFFGVLYHLRHPMLALDILRDITQGRLFLQTMTCPGAQPARTPPNITLEERDLMNGRGWPRMAFIEHTLENDPTNWWAPNDPCVESMLRAAGLRVTGRPADEMYIAEPNPAESAINAWSRQSELDAIFGPANGG